MKWTTGFIFVPLLSSFLAVDLAWAQSIASTPAHPKQTPPGTPTAERSHPTPLTLELPPSLMSSLPASSVSAIPDAALDHRSGGQTVSQLPPEVSNTPPPKQPARYSRPESGTGPESGGEDIATATPIPSLPFGDSGNTCSFRDDYTPPCGAPGGADVVYVYSPQAAGCIRVSLCNSSYDTEILVAVDSPANVIACNDDFCGLSSEVNNISVAAGHNYYIIVDGFGVSCGDYHLLVEDCPPPPPPPPPVQCPPEAMNEGEPDCSSNYVDNYNGGCNSSPPAFTDLPCSTDTIKVCGTYGTYLTSGILTRDTDWYRVTINKATTLRFCVTGQYETVILVVDGRSGCGGAFVVTSTVAGPGQTACLAPMLARGTYYLVVTTYDFDGVPCGSNYSMALVADTCAAPFALQCPSGTRAEGEPTCYDGYVDFFNAGCNSAPPTFISPYGEGTGNSDCVAGTVRVCGTYGTYLRQGFEYRDTDWYQIIVNGTSHLRYCAVGEAPTQILVLDGTGGCSSLSVVCFNSGDVGDTICCDVTVGAGTYWLFVATLDFAGVPCGSRYMISVTREACPEPVHVDCPPGAHAEGEAVCSGAYEDETNGGCNSEPPVFTDVHCSQRKPIEICGTYGTYQFQGINFRDTDWYQIELTTPRLIRCCVIGEAPTSVIIVGGSAGCAATSIEASGSGAQGDSICLVASLPPGTYWLFVAPSTFTGVPCGSRYVVTISGYKCGDVAAVGGGGIAGALAIRAITPNPATGMSRIDYELPHDGTMRLEVYDIGGHRVRVLVGQHLAPGGTGSAFWDGRNDRGRTLPTGAYFIRLIMDARVVTRRLVFIR